MQVSVGSSVLPKNCHRCTSPEWGHVTANTSVVHAAVCTPEISFPEQLAINKKNKDELKWEKAFPACTHLPPPHCSCLPCCAVTRLMGTMHEPVATAGDNTLRELPSQVCLRSSAISRRSLRPFPSAPVSNALSPFRSEESRLIAKGTCNGHVRGGQTGAYKSITIIYTIFEIFVLTPSVCLFHCLVDKTKKVSK